MADGGDPSRNPLGRQPSISSLEQSLNMVNAPPSIAPVTIYPGPGAKHANMPKADLELMQRLKQLRHGDNEVPSESEMAERLAKLKGLPSDYYTKQSLGVILNMDRRTDCQKADDLLSQIAEEVSLDKKIPNPDDDLAERLAKLRSEGASSSQTTSTAAASDKHVSSPDSPPSLQEMERYLLEESMIEVSEAAAASTRRKKKLKVRKKETRRPVCDSTDEEEKISDSTDEELLKRVMNKASVEDEAMKEEVARVIDYYTKKAKKKKKPRNSTEQDQDSDLDSSSQLSDTDPSTSEDEKFSDSS